MSADLEGKLVEILSQIQSGVQAAGTFALEQLPDIAQSYVLYGRVIHLAQLAVGLGLIGVAIWVMREIYRVSKGKPLYEVTDPIAEWGPAVAIVAGITGVALTAIAAAPTALVWLAPKVWLLKEIAGLVK